MDDPARLRTRFQPSTALYPFTSRWFPATPGRVHYLDEGEGRPILLMHGNPTWSFLYRRMIPGLVARGFRCIAPDLLGYGLSDHPADFRYTAGAQADVISELVRALELRDAILMGQDWGGPIGLRTVADEAGRFAGLVLGSTFAWPTRGIVRLVARILRSRTVQRWILGRSFVPRVIKLLTQIELTPEELAHYRDVFDGPELRRGLQVLPLELIDADSWLATLEADVIARLGGTPTLLIHGTKEGYLGRVSIKQFRTMLPEGPTVSIRGAGHFFPEDAPEATVAAIGEAFGRPHRDHAQSSCPTATLGVGKAG